MTFTIKIPFTNATFQINTPSVPVSATDWEDLQQSISKIDQEIVKIRQEWSLNLLGFSTTNEQTQRLSVLIKEIPIVQKLLAAQKQAAEHSKDEALCIQIKALSEEVDILYRIYHHAILHILLKKGASYGALLTCVGLPTLYIANELRAYSLALESGIAGMIGFYALFVCLASQPSNNQSLRDLLKIHDLTHQMRGLSQRVEELMKKLPQVPIAAQVPLVA